MEAHDCSSMPGLVTGWDILYIQWTDFTKHLVKHRWLGNYDNAAVLKLCVARGARKNIAENDHRFRIPLVV